MVPSVADVLLTQPEEVVSAIAQDPTLYFFSVDERCILFRIDGLVVQVSRPLFELFSHERDIPAATRLGKAEQTHGPEVIAAVIDDLRRLLAQGLLGTHLPEFIPFSGGRARSGILIMVTQTCNLACLYCYADAGTYRQPTKFQAWRNVEAAIDQLIAHRPEGTKLRVTFFGGEPLLGFDMIRKTVAYCSSKARETNLEFEYAITTNATIVTDEIAAFLKEHAFLVMASFDGTEYFQDKYRPFTNGQGSFNAARKGIRRLVDAGIPVMLRATVVKEMANRAAFEGAIETTKSLGVKRLMLSPVDCSQTSSPGFALDADDAALLGRLAAEVTLRNMDVGSAGSVFDLHAPTIEALAHGRAVGTGRCGAFGGASAVATNGKIYPCHRFVGMEAYQIGSLDEGGFDEARVSEFLRRATEATFPKCRSCMARLVCGGLCFNAVADGHGGFKEPDEIRCDSIRDNLKRSVAYLLMLNELPPEQARRYAHASATSSEAFVDT